MSQTSIIEIQDFALWKKMENQRAFFSFDLELTARCNNNCRHCYINLPAGDRQAQKQELSLEEIGAMAEQAVSLGAMWCLVTGGEPLLRQDFSQIYMLLKKKGLLVSIFTNACLITPEHVTLFKRYPPRDIEVSVYGVTRQTYEAVTRKPGSYTQFRRGLDLLINNAIRVRLKAMAMRSNVHELPEIALFCRQYTKDYFRFDPVLHLRYDGDEQRNAGIHLERLSPEEIVTIEQADEQRADALRKSCDKLIVPELAQTGGDHLFGCGAGSSSFTVSFDGHFQLCSDLRQPDCRYNLRQGSLAEAWHDFVPRVLDMRSTNPEFLAKCHRCPIINLCLGCPARGYLETGRLDGWCEYFCQVAHARTEAVHAGLQGALPKDE